MGLSLGKRKANRCSQDDTNVTKKCHPQHEEIDCFARLPNEILIKILSELKYLDRYFLAKVFPSIQKIVQSFRYTKIDLSLDYRLVPEIAEEIFAPSEYLDSVTCLNLNGVYWFSKETLSMFICRVKNVEVLFILGTRLLYKDLVDGEIINLTKLANVAVIDYNDLYSRLECNRYWSITCVRLRKFDQKSSASIFLDYSRQVLELERDFYQTIILIQRQHWEKSHVFKKVRNYRKKYDDDTIIVNLGMLSDLIEFKKTCAQNFNTREFVLKNCKWICGAQTIDLSLVKQLKRLRTLNLELFGDYKTNCLDDIFKSCQELRTVKIVTDVPNLKLANFEHAKNLEDFSFNTSCEFQVNKFLIDLKEAPHLKLKRLMLRYDNTKSFSKRYLANYLAENSQLSLFYIMCNTKRRARTKVQKIFKRFIKSPTQLYLIERLPSCYVPFVHVDMFRNCCCIKSNVSFVIYNK